MKTFIALGLLLLTGSASADLPSGSVYRLSLKFTDQKGDAVAWHRLQGKPRVVAMIYTQCKFVCPMTVADLKRMESSIPTAALSRVGFVLVSIDSKRDESGALRAYARAKRLDPERWTLLTGDADTTRQLAAVLGVRYSPTAAGDFAHTALITILDADGKILTQQESTGHGVDEANAALIKLLRP
jgi:protein SCO1/2